MNRPRELFVPARITDVCTYDQGEVRKVALTLPETFEVDGRPVPVRDCMRPGSAFLVKPFGVRTQKYRRRMYTRTNCADESPRVLETIINDTHKEKADTSPWWQTDDLVQRSRTGGSIDVCVNYDETRSELVVYQNSHAVDPTTLVLEDDHEWRSMRIVAVALSTGITPFLSYLRYMKGRAFGTPDGTNGGHLTLIVSVKTPRQLMEHQTLLDLGPGVSTTLFVSSRVDPGMAGRLVAWEGAHHTSPDERGTGHACELGVARCAGAQPAAVSRPVLWKCAGKGSTCPGDGASTTGPAQFSV